MSKPIRFGVQPRPENTTWREVRAAWKLIDELGYDTAWTFDHFFPVLGDPTGPCLEGWITLAALAAETSRVRVGVLVTGNTYRHPALLANMGATLDHTSGGRLIMGLGAAWFQMEHAAYGLPFYTTAERIRRLDEAAAVIKRLWTEKQTTFDGRFYQLKDASCEPKPIQQPHPPIMIGAAGEKLALRVVAKHADLWNTFGTPDVFRHKIAVLGEHCLAVGRHFDEIEISWAGTTLITDSQAEKDAVVEQYAAAFRKSPREVEAASLVGSMEEVRARIERYIEVGVTHFILTLQAPFHRETLRLFAEKIIPAFRG